MDHYGPPLVFDASAPGFRGIIEIDHWLIPGDVAIARLYHPQDLEHRLLWLVVIDSPQAQGWFRAPFLTLSKSRQKHAGVVDEWCMLEVSISEHEHILVKFFTQTVPDHLSPR